MHRAKIRVCCFFFHYSSSLRKGTFFAKSHLSLLDICGFVYLWTMNCLSFIMQNQLRFAKNTVADWNSFLREVTFDGMIVKKCLLGGVDRTVEIDESKFGKRKYHCRHRVEGQWCSEDMKGKPVLVFLSQ